jgi:hypothetical protein
MTFTYNLATNIGKVQELCRAEYCVDIAPGDGVVWTWLLPERQDDLRGLAW